MSGADSGWGPVNSPKASAASPYVSLARNGTGEFRFCDCVRAVGGSSLGLAAWLSPQMRFCYGKEEWRWWLDGRHAASVSGRGEESVCVCGYGRSLQGGVAPGQASARVSNCGEGGGRGWWQQPWLLAGGALDPVPLEARL